MDGLRWAGGDRRDLWRRLALLAVGTALMGVGIALLVRARLGLVPMDVTHVGVAHVAGFTLGGGIVATQSVLLISIVLCRINVGVGMVVAFVVPAVVADVMLAIVPDGAPLALRIVELAGGGALCCLGVAIYLHADLASMPRERDHDRARQEPTTRYSGDTVDHSPQGRRSPGRHRRDLCRHRGHTSWTCERCPPWSDRRWDCRDGVGIRTVNRVDPESTRPRSGSKVGQND